MLTSDDYKRWLHDCLTMGIPAISIDTSARILAVVMVLGNNEGMVMSSKCKDELDYIQRRFGIEGGRIPDSAIVQPFKDYVSELETSDEVPLWALNLFKRRYGIRLYK